MFDGRSTLSLVHTRLVLSDMRHTNSNGQSVIGLCCGPHYLASSCCLVDIQIAECLWCRASHHDMTPGGPEEAGPAIRGWSLW